MPEFSTRNSIAASGVDILLTSPFHEMLLDVADSAVGDFNGDGFDDYLVRVPKGIATNPTPQTPPRIVAEAEWKLSLGSATGLTSPVDVSLPGSKGSYASLSARVMDLDLDGKDDVLLVRDEVFTGGVEAQTYDVYQFDGTDFIDRMIGETLSVPQLANTPARSASLTIGDIDGDGVPDITSTDGPVNTPGLGAALRVRRGEIVAAAFSLTGGEQVPTPTNLKPVPGEEKHLLDLNGDGRPEMLGRVSIAGLGADENSAPNNTDALGPFLHSFDLRSGTAFENRDTRLWAKDLTLSKVAEDVGGIDCTAQGRRDFLSRIFMDVDGDGLRDSVSFPNRDNDTCATVRHWQGSVFTSINQGGVFTAPTHQVLQSGAYGQLRIGPTLVPEVGMDWSDSRDDRLYRLEDREVSTSRTIDNGLRVIDFDEDGKQDLMLVGDLVPALNYAPTARTITVALSNGAGFDAPVETTLSGAPSLSDIRPGGTLSRWGRGSGPRSVRTGDFNGDGRFDIAMMVAIGSHSVSILTHTQNAREPDVIEKVAAGLHTQADSFTFEFLGPQQSTRLPPTACRVQVGGSNGATTILQRCPKKFGWVVTKASREANNFDDGVESIETTYRYGTPVIDTRGRGFLGFASRETTVEGLTETVSIDSSSWFNIPGGGYAYALKRTRLTAVSTTSGLVTSESTSTPTLAASRAGYRLSTRASTSVTKEAGTETSSTKSTLSYDEYGAVTNSLAEWLDTAGTPFSSREIKLDDNTAADELNWFVNRYKTRTDTSTEGTELTKRTTEFAYDPDSTRLSKITIEPDAADEDASTNGIKLITDLRYDAVGNLYEIESSNRLDRRLTTFKFDALDRQYLVETTNAMNHQQYLYWNAGLGLQFAADDANHVRERTSFDAYLRPLTQLSGLLASDDVTRGGPETTFRYTKVMERLSEKRSYWLCATSSAEGQNCSLVDPAGHATQLAWNNYDGVTSQTLVYDLLGRVVAESLPKKDPRQTPAFVTRSFDRINRIQEQSRPGESLSAQRLKQKWVYSPHEVTHTNERDVQTTTTFDRKGRQTKTTTFETGTAHSVMVEYQYATFDQPSRTIHPALNLTMNPAPAVTALETAVEYDVLGRAITLTDPDLGTETRLYSGFGDLKQTTDANGGVTTYSRDSIGRTTMVETPANGHYPARPNGSAMYTTFDWDTAPNGIGQVASATSADGVTTDFAFDAFSRPSTTSWESNGAQFQFWREYDPSGRISKLHYPSAYTTRPFVVRYDYGHTAAPRSIWDVSGTMPGAVPAAPASLLWHAISQHGNGMIEEQQFGNTTRDTRRFDTGHHLRFIGSTSIQSGAALQKLSYTWNRGLIESKTDLSTQASEQYGHDFLGRLSNWKVDQNCMKAEWHYQYDDWGNLRKREWVAGPGHDVVSQFTTASDRTHPHAVKELVENGISEAYAYKPGGQAEVVRGKKVQWAPFGLPVQVTDGLGEAKYDYDAFSSRFRTSETSSTGMRDIISINGLFEQEVSLGSGNVVYKYSVHGPEGLVAQVRRDFATGLANEISYIHADHLGSPDTVTNAAGAVVERIKHDPFGERRHPWAIAHPVAESLVLDSQLGFTTHTGADQFGLTNMGGRIYDPKAARFLSPDPFVSRGSEGLSRHSYVRNSPIMRVDPSGFTDLASAMGWFADAASPHKTTVRAPRTESVEASSREAVTPPTSDQQSSSIEAASDQAGTLTIWQQYCQEMNDSWVEFKTPPPGSEENSAMRRLMRFDISGLFAPSEYDLWLVGRQIRKTYDYGADQERDGYDKLVQLVLATLAIAATIPAASPEKPIAEVVVGFHGADGSKILYILEHGLPPREGQVFLASTLADTFPHGADLARKAAFSLELEAKVPVGSLVRAPMPSNMNAVIIRSETNVPVTVHKMHVRTANGEGGFSRSVIEGVEAIRDFLGGK